MLCQSHGLLVIPSHVVEYLLGCKRTLLGGLGGYQGGVVEILSASEWDALQETLNSFSDFSVRFSLDGENINWNIGICPLCSSESIYTDSVSNFKCSQQHAKN